MFQLPLCDCGRSLKCSQLKCPKSIRLGFTPAPSPLAAGEPPQEEGAADVDVDEHGEPGAEEAVVEHDGEHVGEREADAGVRT